MRKREIEDGKMKIAFAEYKFWSQLQFFLKLNFILNVYVFAR